MNDSTRNVATFALTALFVILLSSVATAQSGGRIVETTGEPASAARVRIVRGTGHGHTIRQTRADGNFTLSGLTRDSFYTLVFYDADVAAVRRNAIVPMVMRIHAPKSATFRLNDIWVRRSSEVDHIDESAAIAEAIDHFGIPESAEDATELAALRSRHEAISGQKQLQALVPCYFAGASFNQCWQDLIAAAESGQVDINAIVNPNSGPGESVDRRYTNNEILPRAHEKGIRLLGYIVLSLNTIDDDWDLRSIEDLKADVDNWLKLYNRKEHPLSGFFLDNCPRTARQRHRLVELRSYIESLLPTATVIANPGVACSDELVSSDIADVIVGCERKCEDLETPIGLPPWADSSEIVPQFAMLLHATEDSDWKKVFRDPAIDSISYFYADDGTDRVEWTGLATSFLDQVTLIRQLNRYRRNHRSHDFLVK
ncbi:MAG: spherulation-specific family 4 protein [Planctomycetaceae bacterium]